MGKGVVGRILTAHQKQRSFLLIGLVCHITANELRKMMVKSLHFVIGLSNSQLDLTQQKESL